MFDGGVVSCSERRVVEVESQMKEESVPICLDLPSAIYLPHLRRATGRRWTLGLAMTVFIPLRPASAASRVRKEGETYWR